MRRTGFVFVSVTAFALSVAVAQPAGAVGPGGWNHVGVGATSTQASLDGAVYALNTDNPGVLYAGGNFTSAGGNSKAKRIARWNGSNWSSLGTTPLADGAVFAIAYHAGKVYVGGTFHNAGGNPDADFLAVYDGNRWAPACTSTVGGPAITATVDALQIVGNTLYVGGSFADGAGIPSADYLVGCDLSTGAASSTASADGSINGAVLALTADSNGTLYAGGQFINLEQIPEADHIAAYDGTWHAMGGSATAPAVDSFVRSLTAVGTDVYIGTDSVNVAGIAQADHVARWNGSTWSAMGGDTAGTNGWFSTPTAYTIDGLAHYGSLVIATGSFQNANGIATADGVAYFDGSQWHPIGSDGAGNGPWIGHGVTTAVTSGQVYVGGNFTSAGGDTLARSLAAYGLRLPDASIGGSSSGHFTGNNVYSSTGSGETRKVKIQHGTSENVYVKIQNDGLAPASFQIKGAGAGTGITPHYFSGGTNITSDVVSGTYSTPTIAARGSMLLRLHIVVANQSAGAATLITTVRSTSGTPSDAVRAVVDATG
jgi:hypothetical protein